MYQWKNNRKCDKLGSCGQGHDDTRHSVPWTSRISKLNWGYVSTRAAKYHWFCISWFISPCHVHWEYFAHTMKISILTNFLSTASWLVIYQLALADSWTGNCLQVPERKINKLIKKHNGNSSLCVSLCCCGLIITGGGWTWPTAPLWRLIKTDSRCFGCVTKCRDNKLSRTRMAGNLRSKCLKSSKFPLAFFYQF